MGYTLGQAAKAVGRSKPTIQRSIKSGRLSATLKDDGSYEIDPAELHRVYPVPGTVTGNMKQVVTHDDTHVTPGVFQESVDAFQRLLDEVRGERDYLRHRLEDEAADRRAAAEEIRRLTLMLTHDRTPPSGPSDADSVARTSKQPMTFWLLIALAAVVGFAGAYFLLNAPSG